MATSKIASEALFCLWFTFIRDRSIFIYLVYFKLLHLNYFWCSIFYLLHHWTTLSWPFNSVDKIPLGFKPHPVCFAVANIELAIFVCLFFSGKWYLSLGPQRSHCFWVVMSSKISQWTELYNFYKEKAKHMFILL